MYWRRQDTSIENAWVNSSMHCAVVNRQSQGVPLLSGKFCEYLTACLLSFTHGGVANALTCALVRLLSAVRVLACRSFLTSPWRANDIYPGVDEYRTARQDSARQAGFEASRFASGRMTCRLGSRRLRETHLQPRSRAQLRVF